MIKRTGTPLTSYPSTLPCPSRQGYSVSHGSLVTSTIMQDGWTRKRQQDNSIQRTATLVFRMNTTQLKQWHIFAHDHGFDWFNMELQSDETTATVEPFLSTSVVRFTGNADFAYEDWDTVTVSIQAEFYVEPINGVPRARVLAPTPTDLDDALISLYPSDFPVPSIIGYSGQIGYNPVRSVEQGFPDQERYQGTNPTSMNVSFRMPLKLYDEWADWMQAYAVTNWIQMPCVDQYSDGTVTKPLQNQIVRGGDWVMSPLGANYVAVSMVLDILPQDIGKGIHGDSGGISPPAETLADWIVGGSPGAPSNPDWVVAGSPGAPSTPDWVNSQTPPDHIGT